MNTKKVQQTFDEVVKELSNMSCEDFKNNIETSKGEIAAILIEGGFLNHQNKNISDEESGS